MLGTSHDRAADRAVSTTRHGRAITWQSLVVALVCVVVDAGRFLLTGHGTGWVFWIVLLAVVLVDLALTAPPRWTREIAITHAVLAAITPLAGVAGPGEVNNAGFVVAGFLAGSWLRTRAACVALGCLVLGLSVNQVIDPDGTYDWRMGAVLTTTSCLLPWLVGRFTMARRSYIAELEQHADRLRRDEQAAVQRAVAKERSTIARDLHDVISHHVSTIGMHAGAARLGLANPDSPVSRSAVSRSLSEVESASRAAMVDLRRLLDVLHGDGTDSGRRQPGLDSIDELLDGVRAAGLPVRLATHGQGGELPGSVDVAVYRVVQEALTNAVRHGDRAGADVELRHRPDGITVIVTNGIPPPARTGGDEQRPRRGLAGLRQRVGLLGGTVRYGPEPGARSWRCEADFPVERT